jgi:hypothetical protein
MFAPFIWSCRQKIEHNPRKKTIAAAKCKCVGRRVARWFVFKPKIQILVKFGGPLNGKCYILWPFGIFYGLLVYFVIIWYIFTFGPRKFWQPRCRATIASKSWDIKLMQSTVGTMTKAAPPTFFTAVKKMRKLWRGGYYSALTPSVTHMKFGHHPISSTRAQWNTGFWTKLALCSLTSAWRNAFARALAAWRCGAVGIASASGTEDPGLNPAKVLGF